MKLTIDTTEKKIWIPTSVSFKELSDFIKVHKYEDYEIEASYTLNTYPIYPSTQPGIMYFNNPAAIPIDNPHNPSNPYTISGNDEPF